MEHKGAKTDSNGTMERQSLMDFSALTPKAAFIAPKMRLVPSSSGDMRVESDGMPKNDPLQNGSGEMRIANNFIVSFGGSYVTTTWIRPTQTKVGFVRTSAEKLGPKI